MMISIIVVLTSLFVAFMITALEPRLTARSIRLAVLQTTDLPPAEAMSAKRRWSRRWG
jgi:hypothetical protein